jgi:G6PDH family F420-dependent oxidoreductase
VSEATSLPVTTAVTCPTIRIHPAIIAQASATAGVQLDGKFVLGVGSGEALNEHVLGHAWPSVGVRQQMLEEAVDVIRLLHRGDEISHHGRITKYRKHASTHCPTNPCRSTFPASDLRPRNSQAGSATATAWRCPTPNS